MDSTLKRIVEERAREQAARDTGLPLSRLYCEACGRRLWETDEEVGVPEGRTKCKECVANAAKPALPLTPPPALAAVDRKCSRGCGRTLGGNNRSGVCGPCQVAPAAERGAAVAVKAPAAPLLSEASTVGRSFQQTAEGLGLDPEALVETWQRKWLDRVRAAAAEVAP